ncbi:calcium channel protein [Tilletia horrida]|uniref:Calcium-channel protein CCH1 n=1 Tax=Tilletia horrida TaxID=155126 RepID=A0AAN6GRF1_9BASI|nr:calcium channel protein [Tilletia horrida]KAK0552492.1 calcium channel protein [Tilletia horrida]KAK0561780.1 calcium channel protein [Tilletia horrida]
MSDPPSRPATPPSDGLLRPSPVPTPRSTGASGSSNARGDLSLSVSSTGNLGDRLTSHSPTPSYSSSLSYPSANEIHISSYYFGNMDSNALADIARRSEGEWASSASVGTSANHFDNSDARPSYEVTRSEIRPSFEIPRVSVETPRDEPLGSTRFVEEPLEWNTDEEEGRTNLTGAPGRLMRKDSMDVIAAAGGGDSAVRHLGPVGGTAVDNARTGLDRVSKTLRRLSRRVVNFDGLNTGSLQGAGAHVRLPPDEDETMNRADNDSSDEEEVIIVDAAPAQSRQSLHARVGSHVLRGRTLGIFGPSNPVRRSCARLLDNWWIEPVVLTAIVLNVVLLVLQSARSVFKDPRKPGYFDYWQDYGLLAVFCFFTVEIMCRIIVSGLVINPPPIYVPEAVGTESPPPNQENLPELAPVGHAQEYSRKISESNTRHSIAQLGTSLKKTAERALRVDPFDTERPEIYERSPNRVTFPKRPFDYVDARAVSSDSVTPQKGAIGLQPQAAPPPRFRGRTHARVASDRTPVQEKLMERRKATLESANALAERSGTLPIDPAVPFVEAIMAQRAQAAHYAYLRHSWNRVDLVAVISFWVMFALCILNVENTNSYHIYIFRALSVLRAARLLTITTGTTTILQSLKLAAPLLVNVTFFIVFFMILFSIIGIQSFRGSYRRACVWFEPGASPVASSGYSLQQLCGGYVDANGVTQGYLSADLDPIGAPPKGFICPVGQLCVELDTNPMSGIQSFDNIVASLLQIVIIISSNGWSTTMYNMIDSDYFVSCLFFIISLIMMNFWMANLFVAVITNTFATITAETKQSAFTNQKIGAPVKAAEDEKNVRRRRVADVYKRIWSWTKIFWLAAIVADLGIQAARTHYDNPATIRKYDTAELWFTVAFDVEIIFRFFAFLLDNDWRSFLAHRRNIVDFGLALITSVSQIPVIRNSGVYPWLTGFQVARFYRVIAAVPRMEALLYRVFGSMAGLFNMILFLLLMVGLSALIAVQLFRGDIPQLDDDGNQIEMTFKQMYNSYLAMYQIFSSENWTDVLWNNLVFELPFKQTVFAGIFICGWFLFANFIVLQMFIAVINENFGVAEGQKRQQQLEAFLKRNEAPAPSTTQKILNLLSPYRYLRRRNAKILGGEKDADRVEADHQVNEKHKRQRSLQNLMEGTFATKSVDAVKRVLRLDKPEEPLPLDTIRARQFRQSLSGSEMLAAPGSMRNIMSIYQGTHADETGRLFAQDRQLSRMRSDLGLVSGRGMTQAEVDAAYRARANDPRVEAARFLNSHPSYDKSLWLFSNMSPIRRFCQSLHPPSYGERIFGREASKFRNIIFRISIFLAVVGSVVVAGIATPAYRRSWYQDHGLRRDSWFSLLEVLLSVFFVFEFFVKVIADGFAFTPNAFLLDLFVLITLLVNVTTEMAVIGGVSRFTRALKAFRALRLINLTEVMKDTFRAIAIAGAGRIVDASVLALLYIIPYAVWGQRLFSGLLYSCSDGSDTILTKSDCIGEYSASPFQWTFLAPRVWANPTEGSVYSFDDFKSSLLILFEIVSLEGWINVMTAAMSIAGKDRQLQSDSRQINAIFFVIYNLVGAVFVLTLFVSVIIENFQTFSGAAFQTTEQRQWMDLKKLIYRQRPAKRPLQKPTAKFRAWCYERAVQKTGWWSRSITILYILNIIVLMSQRYTDPKWVDQLRESVYLAFTVIYLTDIGVRLYGLGWKSFRESWWNLYDLIVVLGTLATTVPLLQTGSGPQVMVQFQKIFLTGIAFKLVQKSDSLNQLFKLAIASLPAILNLFLLWLTFFLVFAIMLVEVFGLTKWGMNETYSKNFSTLIGSLVFLSMMSTGEGWNSYMHDYVISEPNCTPSINYLDTDCGSVGWAYGLFIGWNVVSMYIFLNMFTGTVVENFSYIFHVGGKMSLSRAQIRGFKKSWAQYDPNRTGYLTKDKLVPFLRSLTGVFDVKSYPAEATVQSLLKSASGSQFPVSPSKGPSALSPFARLRGASPGASSPSRGNSPERRTFKWPPSPSSPSSPKGIVIEGIDTAKLRRALAALDSSEIRRRRIRFNRLYHDALLHDEEGKGITFTSMLTLLARYKLIDESQALEVEELIERRLQMERIDDNINLERVRGVMRMVYLRHRFLAIRNAAKSTLAVPAGYDADSFASGSYLERRGRMMDESSFQRDADSPNTSAAPPIPTIVLDPAPPSRKPTLSLNLSGISNAEAVGTALEVKNQQGNNDSESEGEKTPRMSTSRSAQAILYSHDIAGGDTNASRERLVPSNRPSVEVTDMSTDSGLRESGDRSRLSPSTSPTLDEISRRASPLLQEFQQTRWGMAMRRMSRLSHDVDGQFQFEFDRTQPAEMERDREWEELDPDWSTAAAWRRGRNATGSSGGSNSGSWTIRGVTRSWFGRDGSGEQPAMESGAGSRSMVQSRQSSYSGALGVGTFVEDDTPSEQRQGSFTVLRGHQPRQASRSSGYWPAF